MASHVVVVHTSARTVKIPTTPVKYLTEIRDEACKRFNIKPDQFTLKYNNKPISLSQQIRHSNLPQGARLELVQASRSPSVISVALQLPESEKNVRLTQKFASNTSLWEILRQFESGGGANYNFTQRGVPQISSNGASGAGRLHYEMPVITVMPGHREQSSFVGLQQTLGQLGFDNGSALLKLSFKNSGTPLEEAMAEISQYFKSSEEPLSTAASGAHATIPAQASSIPDPDKAAPEATEGIAGADGQSDAPEPMEVEPSPAPEHIQTPLSPEPVTEAPSTATAPSPSTSQTQPTSIGGRNVQIFSAPTSSTPQAARRAFNENDYEPTIEHAKAHQASLLAKTRNQRLLSDKELAEQEDERLARLNAVAERGARLRVRMPDQSIIEMEINKADTAQTLHDFVRDFLEYSDQPFQLRYLGSKGAPVVMKQGGEKLLQDLRLSSREIVTFVWDENASNEARLSRKPLKQEYQDQARPLKYEEPASDTGTGKTVEKSEGSGKGKGRALGSGRSDVDKESKLKSILGKGLFKR